MKVRVLFKGEQEALEIEAVSFERCSEYMIVREDYRRDYPYTRSVHVIPYNNVLDIVTEEGRR